MHYLWLLLVWATAVGGTTPRFDRPSVIFLTADCITFDRLGAYGGTSKQLPAIDRLANGGARFDNFYVSPGESVTTVTLLTGRYPFRHGWMWHNDVPLWGPPSLSSERELCVARPLRDHGYATALAGKWQLNDLKKETNALAGHGFDRALDREALVGYVKGQGAKPFFLYARLGNADVKSINSLVEELVAYLTESKLSRRTIFVISRESLADASQSLREPWIKAPLLVYGTFRVKQGVITDLVDFSDLFPTLLELTGARRRGTQAIDGGSFAPQLRGDVGRRREWIFSQYGTDRVLSNWQYKIYSNGRFYNLLSDPEEKINLNRTSVSEVVAERERLRVLLKGLPADQPLNFPYARRLRVRTRR